MSPFRFCWRLMLLAVVGVTVRSVPASACDFGYRALPELFEASTDVFVGTVTESVFSRGADGRIVPRPGGAALDFRFKVLARYKGAFTSEMVLSFGGGDCTYPFVEGATYLVHAFVTGPGEFTSGQGSRPILISLDGRVPAPRDNNDPATYWSSELAIAYAEARVRGRPHAFIMASVLGISGDIAVYAERVGGPTVTLRAPNTPWNLYEMVLAPGRYRFGVKQNGTQIGDAVTLTVANGESRRVNLGPGWPR